MTTSNTVQSVEKFAKEMADFIAYAKKSVASDPNNGGRTKFPDFVITEVIRQKVQVANKSLQEGELTKAFTWLEDVQDHFQNQQAAWAKGLRQGIVDDLTDLSTRKCPEDLIMPARKAVGLYEELMSQKFFDLNKASAVYWKAIDALDKTENSWEDRILNQKKKVLQEARERQEFANRQAQERANAQNMIRAQQQKQACAQAADKLKELVESF